MGLVPDSKYIAISISLSEGRPGRSVGNTSLNSLTAGTESTDGGSIDTSRTKARQAKQSETTNHQTRIREIIPIVERL